MRVEARLPEPFPVVPAAELAADSPAPAWLVRDVWLHQGVGWCAGAAKLGKTWVGLELALSVASNTPFLGRFPVEQPGPALLYLAEDSRARVRERLVALCTYRRLDLDTLPLSIIDWPRIRLDDPADRDRLDATLAKCKPRIMGLDPIVRMHSCDESSATEMSGLLGFLRELSRRHNIALIVTHHMTKRNHNRPGQALRGSTDLHAWSDSSAYLTQQKNQLLLTLEHRSAPAPDPIPLRLVCAPDVPPHLEIVEPDGTTAPPSLDEQIRRHLLEVGEPVTRDALRRLLRVNNARLGEALTLLERQGLIVRTPPGWVARALSRSALLPIDGQAEPSTNS